MSSEEVLESIWLSQPNTCDFNMALVGASSQASDRFKMPFKVYFAGLSVTRQWAGQEKSNVLFIFEFHVKGELYAKTQV